MYYFRLYKLTITTYIFVISILSKKEKEELVIKLLYEGLPFKEIAKRVHMSLSDISKIKRKITGEAIEEKEKNEKPLSASSQAFKLFKEGKSLIDVAIILDAPKETVRFKIMTIILLTLDNTKKFLAIKIFVGNNYKFVSNSISSLNMFTK